MKYKYYMNCELFEKCLIKVSIMKQCRFSRHAFRWHAYHNTAGLVDPNAHGSSFFQHTGKMTSGQQDRMEADGPVLQYLPCIWIRK